MEMCLSQVSDVSGEEEGSADLPPARAGSPHLKDTEERERDARPLLLLLLLVGVQDLLLICWVLICPRPSEAAAAATAFISGLP